MLSLHIIKVSGLYQNQETKVQIQVGEQVASTKF